MSASLALGVGNIEGVVRGTVLDGEVDELEILLLGQVILQVTVQGATTIGVLIGLLAVQDELIQNAGIIVCIVEV